MTMPGLQPSALALPSLLIDATLAPRLESMRTSP